MENFKCIQKQTVNPMVGHLALMLGIHVQWFLYTRLPGPVPLRGLDSQGRGKPVLG